jgi:DNA-binding transcriptional regulator YiaG
MPNIATAFKEEISRLCRKEMRKHIEPLRKASAAYRKEIAALKRQLQESERRVGVLAKRSTKSTEAAEALPEKQTRFVSKGLKSLRVRLGLSAAELAKLLGVTGQSIYNWEQKKSTPRAAQLAQLAELRSLGKKSVRAKLEESGSESASEKPARARKARQTAATDQPVRARKARKAAAADKPVRARRTRRANPAAAAAE